MEPSTQRSIAEHAAQQLGHLTRRQLNAHGLPNRTVLRWEQASRLVKVGSRTFRLGGVPISWRGSVMAACLDHDGVASHRTAARLHGLEGFTAEPTIEILVPHRHNSAVSQLGLVHRTTSLPAEDVVTIDGIPTTTVARTILGLAALDDIAEDVVRGVVDAAIRDRIASDRWLWWHLEHRRCHGRNGVMRMESILSEREQLGPTESWLERAFLRCVAAMALPWPTVQRRVGARGAFVARVDFLYGDRRLVVEVLGYRHHSTKVQLDADSQRENELLLLGFRVLKFTHDDVVRRPGYVAATVAAALGLASAA